jgi:tRNA threonylcarbamoyladenosine biosynthesis protein TsaB
VAIDTTAGLCSAALWLRGRSVHVAEPMGQGHSRRALAMLAELMTDAGLVGGDVDAIGFGAGPGSFTGLRIACGLAQGLGLGWDRPVVPVDSMQTLAWQALQQAPGRDGPAGLVLVALDARMGQVYRSAWRRLGPDEPGHDDLEVGAGRPVRFGCVLEAGLADPAAARDEFERLLDGQPVARVGGDGFTAHAVLARWLEGVAGRVEAPDDAVQPDARAVVLRAVDLLAHAGGVAPERAAPLYLREKVALDVAEQATLRQTLAAGRAAAEGRRR